MGMFERLDGPIDLEYCTVCGALVDTQHRLTHSMFHDELADTEKRLNQTIKWAKDAFVRLGKVFDAFP